MGRVGHIREKEERYARLSFPHDDAAIDPAVCDELYVGVVCGIVVCVRCSWCDEVGVGWMRCRAVEVEDRSEFVSACRCERRRERITHAIEDGHSQPNAGRVARVTNQSRATLTLILQSAVTCYPKTAIIAGVLTYMFRLPPYL